MISRDDPFYARLEQLGPDAVRTLMASGGFATSYHVRITEWLAEKDHEQRRLAASSDAEQIEIARRASSTAERAAIAAEAQATEARRANTRATIALAMAIISIIVSAIGIWLPLWDAHK